MGSRCDPSRVIPAVAYAEAYRSQRHNTEVRLSHRWRFEPFVSLTIYTDPLSRKGEVLEVEQSDPEPLFHLSGTGGSNPVPSSGGSVSHRRAPPVEARRKKSEFEAGLVPCQTQSPANYRREPAPRQPA